MTVEDKIEALVRETLDEIDDKYSISMDVKSFRWEEQGNCLVVYVQVEPFLEIYKTLPNVMLPDYKTKPLPFPIREEEVQKTLENEENCSYDPDNGLRLVFPGYNL